VILHRCYTYSWYQEGEGLKAWTSDVQGFNADDRVILFAKEDGKVHVEFDGYYPDFKKLKDTKYSIEVNGKPKSFLKWQNLLYVLYEGQVYRMFVSTASAAGVADGEKGGDLRNPQQGSLLAFIETTRGDQVAKALCEWKCMLGSRFKDDVEQPYYIRTFENMGENTDIAEAEAQFEKLITNMGSQQKRAVEKIAIDTEAPIDVQGTYASETKVEDLPW